MKIVRVESWRRRVPLVRPYRIATHATESVELCLARVVPERGATGLGAASPSPEVTGETEEACAAALAEGAPASLVGRDARELGARLADLSALHPTPAARAAVDMALHDLFARHVGVPVFALLGGSAPAPLATSVTIGIRSTEETLAEADEYLARGFRHLKVKVGLDLTADLERLRALHEHVRGRARLRVDANGGYELADARRMIAAAPELDLELIEQPVPRERIEGLRTLPAPERARLGLDESLHDLTDALDLARPPTPAHTWVQKLMKSGGIAPARTIAEVACAADIGLMWGCMDESRLSITAALHLALASPATRFIDLDGHLDLADDPATGGFTLEGGALTPTGGPGLDTQAGT